MSFLKRLSVIIWDANNQLYEGAEVSEKQQQKIIQSAQQDKQSEVGLRIGISAVLGREKYLPYALLILCPH